ncbi:hypothetical protein V2G26_001646 [Clonostachys chloroleuca]
MSKCAIATYKSPVAESIRTSGLSDEGQTSQASELTRLTSHVGDEDSLQLAQRFDAHERAWRRKREELEGSSPKYHTSTEPPNEENTQNSYSVWSRRGAWRDYLPNHYAGGSPALSPFVGFAYAWAWAALLTAIHTLLHYRIPVEYEFSGGFRIRDLVHTLLVGPPISASAFSIYRLVIIWTIFGEVAQPISSVFAAYNIQAMCCVAVIFPVFFWLIYVFNSTAVDFWI